MTTFLFKKKKSSPTERGGLTEDELEEWWQNERAKIKPLDKSFFELQTKMSE
jgi:hypothetical protein